MKSAKDSMIDIFGREIVQEIKELTGILSTYKVNYTQPNGKIIEHEFKALNINLAKEFCAQKGETKAEVYQID